MTDPTLEEIARRAEAIRLTHDEDCELRGSPCYCAIAEIQERHEIAEVCSTDDKDALAPFTCQPQDFLPDAHADRGKLLAVVAYLLSRLRETSYAKGFLDGAKAERFEMHRLVAQAEPYFRAIRNRSSAPYPTELKVALSPEEYEQAMKEIKGQIEGD